MSPEELDLPESLRDPEKVLSDTGAAGRLKQAIAGMSQEDSLRILLYASDAENEKLRGLLRRACEVLRECDADMQFRRDGPANKVHAMVGECEEATR